MCRLSIIVLRYKSDVIYFIISYLLNVIRLEEKFINNYMDGFLIL